MWLNCSSFSMLLNKQNLRWADELHLPGGAEGGMLLAQQAGGRVLHPGPQALLPQLLAVGPPPPGPSQRHPGSLYRCAHPGHPADDGSGGVEEQTQWGDRVVTGKEVSGDQTDPLASRRFESDPPPEWPKNLSSVFTGNHIIGLAVIHLES